MCFFVHHNLAPFPTLQDLESLRKCAVVREMLMFCLGKTRIILHLLQKQILLISWVLEVWGRLLGGLWSGLGGFGEVRWKVVRRSLEVNKTCKKHYKRPQSRYNICKRRLSCFCFEQLHESDEPFEKDKHITVP